MNKKISSISPSNMTTSLLVIFYIIALKPVILHDILLVSKLVLIFIFLCLIYLNRNTLKFTTYPVVVVLFLISLVIIKDGALPFWISGFLPLYLLIFLIRKEYVVLSSIKFESIISFIFFIGMIIHFMTIGGIDLPYFVSSGGDKAELGLYYKNYLFVTHITSFNPTGIDFILPRFNSIFNEPGVVGTLSAFLIYARKMRLNDFNGKVILLAGISSLSMAFFVILFISYLLNGDLKEKISRTILFVLVLMALLSIIYFFVDSNNIIYQYTMDRLFRDNLDNRMDYTISKYWSFYLTNLNLTSFTFGLKTFSHSIFSVGGDGSSMLMFIYDYGFVLMSLVYLLTFISFVKISALECAIPFFILFCISSYQRPGFFEVQYIIAVSCSYYYINKSNIKV